MHGWSYGTQVISRVLSYAIEGGRLGPNPCEGIKALYRNDRSNDIWAKSGLAALKAVASDAVRQGVSLAAHAGLLAEDLRRLC